MKMLKCHPTDGPRQLVLKGGLIHFEQTNLDCFVLNVSSGGAGLVLDSNASIPLTFGLEIDGERLRRRRCRVVWRNDCHLGVSFDPERQPSITFPATPNE
jgi:PilZ domain